MKYQRTQILLDPEEHRRLTREAADRGISLAEYIRSLLAERPARAGEEAAPYRTGFEGITGLFASGGDKSGDLVERIRQSIMTHVAEEYERDMGRLPHGRSQPRRTSKS